MINVVLTMTEIRLAAYVGVDRRVASIRRGLEGKAALSNGANLWAMDVDGALGEMAVAKALNVHWGAGVNTFKLPDVGELHVRSTRHAAGRLILRPDDVIGRYVLVIADCPRFTVVGWVGSEYGRDERYKAVAEAGRPTCWAVPQSDLWDIGELLTRVQR